MGRTVTLQVNLNVRSGPGTNYTRKRRSQLTANGRKTRSERSLCRVSQRYPRNDHGGAQYRCRRMDQDAERLDLREKRKPHLCEIGGGS